MRNSQRLCEMRPEETKISIASKLGCAGFEAAFFIAAIERQTVKLEEV